MKKTYIKIIDQQFELVSANNFWKRFLGLMFRKDFPFNHILKIKPCNAIHTFGMRFNLDVLFCDNAGRLLKVCLNLQPNRVRWCFGASYVYEMKTGNLKDIQNLSIGTKLIEVVYE